MHKVFVLGALVWLSAGQLPARGVGFPDKRADHWHRWRGPEATGVAPHGDPPTDWDEDTNIKWKVAVPGRGSGSPVIWGDRIFLVTAIKTDRTADGTEPTANRRPGSPFRLVQTEAEPAQPSQPPSRGQRRGRFGRRRGFGRGAKPTNVYQFVVLCLDRRTGQTLWQKVATEAVPHEGHHPTGSFASTSPVTDGKNLYVSFGSRGVHSYDVDGNLRWKRDLGQFRMRHSFGEGASPELYGDTLVVNCDHEGQSFITALNANTGETRWKMLRDEETTWGTPLVVEHAGVVQVVVNATNRARAYDLETGEVLWECGGQASVPVATAVAHDGLAFCMTGHRGSALYAIPLDARGDITGSDQIAWSRDRDTSYVPSPLVYGDLLYFLKRNNAILTCVDAASGEVRYEGERLPGLDAIYASPVAAAGRIYLTGRNGTTVVIRHGPQLEVLAENRLGETIDATPAIVGEAIFLRGEQHLYCVAR